MPTVTVMAFLRHSRPRFPEPCRCSRHPVTPPTSSKYRTRPVAAPAPAKPGDAPARRRSTPQRLLDSIALFDALTDDEKDALAATMTRRSFRPGETLVEQGTVLASLMIVR